MRFIKKNYIEVVDLLKEFLPKNRAEYYLLLLLFLFYLSYSLILIFKTTIIDNQALDADIYFSFDNPIILKTGALFGNQAHPLLKFYLYPLLFIGNLFVGLGFYKLKTLFFVVIFNLIISLSSIYVYRYLNEIIGLRNYVLLMLTFLFSFTATNLVLCFTPESYSISLFLLAFTIYYYSAKIKSGATVNFLSSCILAIGLGGVTITNFAKGIIPIFFLKDGGKIKLKKIIFSGLIFAIPVFILFIKGFFLPSIRFALYMNDVTNTIYLPSSALDMLANFFLAAPIMFPEIIMSNVSPTDIPFYAISVDFFSHWWQGLLIVPIFVLMLLSIIRNYKNKYVLMIGCMFLFDIIIHFGVKYGLTSSFIYGGHWIFIIPLLLGWLYSTLESKRLKRIFSVLVSILFVCILINNLWQLNTFIHLALDHFPEIN